MAGVKESVGRRCELKSHRTPSIGGERNRRKPTSFVRREMKSVREGTVMGRKEHGEARWYTVEKGGVGQPTEDVL